MSLDDQIASNPAAARIRGERVPHRHGRCGVERRDGGGGAPVSKPLPRVLVAAVVALWGVAVGLCLLIAVAVT
jgi:hypothetical protein